MSAFSDIEIYNLLVLTANIVSKTEYARFLTLKGDLVLMSKLYQCGRMDMFRRVPVIEVHCPNMDIWLHFCNECEYLLNNSEYAKSQMVQYKLQRRCSVKMGSVRPDALIFGVILGDSRVAEFKITADITNDNSVEIEFDRVLNMRVYSVYTILVDKIVTISSRRLFNRIQDLYDVYVLANLYSFRLDTIVMLLSKKYNMSLRNLTNMLTFENMVDILHLYEGSRFITNKPDIKILIDVTQKFFEPLYKGITDGYVWNSKNLSWVRC